MISYLHLALTVMPNKFNAIPKIFSTFLAVKKGAKMFKFLERFLFWWKRGEAKHFYGSFSNATCAATSDLFRRLFIQSR